MAAGTSQGELMRRAGEGAAQWIWRIAAGRAATVLCGPGNNGGDGYVIAESLRRRGLDVVVIAPVEPSGKAACAARKAYKGKILATAGGRRAPILVDALFGYGLSREVGGDYADLLEKTHAIHGTKIAVDVPSGVESDSGRWLGNAYDYQCTLALGAWKRAHWLMPASAAMGIKKLVPIGLACDTSGETLSSRPRLNAPDADSHKYRRGLLEVVGGAMPGAALLACKAAMHAGAGYVKLLGDHCHPAAPADLVMEKGDLSGVLGDRRIAALLVGPGLGRDDRARSRVAQVLEAGKPAVIDADALHLLDWDMLEGVEAGCLILTPHEGELSALCKSFGVTVESKRDKTEGLRDAIGANILAKGPDTLLASAEGGLVYFPQGSSWLSVAGSGDVLAGIIASRLAGHGDPGRAGEEAVWLHQRAASLAGVAFTATQLVKAVKPALADFL